MGIFRPSVEIPPRTKRGHLAEDFNLSFLPWKKKTRIQKSPSAPISLDHPQLNITRKLDVHVVSRCAALKIGDFIAEVIKIIESSSMMTMGFDTTLYAIWQYNFNENTYFLAFLLTILRKSP